MSHHPPHSVIGAYAGAAALLVLLAGTPLRADWRDDVGYTRLIQTYTSGVPSAVVDGVAQVEAGNADGDFYLPNPADSRFAGKTFVNKSSGTGVSGHATGVGANFYGSPGSLIPGTTTVDAYGADEWLSDLPYIETRRVQNHSWIVGQLDAGADAETTVRHYNVRFDHMATRSDTICVAGVNNGHSTTLPYLLAQSYNGITVGLTNGQHSAGLTAYDGAGRVKPDLVAPDTLTSFATPQVSSAAGLLAQKLIDVYPEALGGGGYLSRNVKALLFAGATKEEFATWSRTSARPIDLRYGFGELNVLLSYRMLLAGPNSGSTSATQPSAGWSAGRISSLTSANARTYFFDLPEGSASPRFSAALVWHRAVTQTYSTSLANLDLTLYSVAAGTFALGSAVQTSESAVDNLEHIYAPGLPAGRYALQVSSGDLAATDYALAWRALPTVTVVATTPVAREQDGSPGVFTITRTGPATSPLLVPLAWGGTSVSGVHYTTPPASVLIPAGSASAAVSVGPVADSAAQGDRTVTLTLAFDWSLSAGSPANATVTLQDKPYDAWRFVRFTSAELSDSAVAGETADPDGDGLPNLLEYALGAEPLAPDSAARRPSAATTPDGRLTLTHFQPSGRGDIAYAVEWAADLAAAAWQSGPGVVTETARVATEGGELVTVQATTDLASSPRQFLRLRVTRL